jgi:hypothetical protein
MGCATISSEPRAERGEGKRRSCWAGSHPPSRTTTPCHNISREEHFDCPWPHGTCACVASRNLRNNSSSHIKAAAIGKSCNVRHGVHNFVLRAPGRAGGKQAKELLGRTTSFSEPRAERGESKRRSCWAGSHPPSRTTQPCKNIPQKNISIVQGHTELLHVWRPATFDTLLLHTLKLRQWTEAAKCGVGATLFSEPRAERGGEGEGRSCWAGPHPPSRTTTPCQFKTAAAGRSCTKRWGAWGEGKRRSCWAGSHPPSRTTTPCQIISREEHCDCPGPHGTSAIVACRNLRGTSNSHFKTAAVEKSVTTFFAEPRAERREPKRRSC